MLLQLTQTFAVAFAGGFLFQLMHIPLPWTLGPMAAVIVVSMLAKRQLYFLSSIRDTALIFIGYTMGRPFTTDTLHQIAAQLPTMVLATVSTILFSLLVAYITNKKMQITLSSSLLGNIPGGLSQMTVLCEEIPKADITQVTFMQTARLILVISMVPFLVVYGLGHQPSSSIDLGQATGLSFFTQPYLALEYLIIGTLGALGARFMHLPTPFMLGPVLATAAAVLSGIPAPVLPNSILNLAQVCMGIYMGVKFNPSKLNNWQILLPYTLIGVFAVLGFTFALGFALTYLQNMSLITAFLATAPGGMAEMCLTAIIANADLSVVLAYQLFRLLFILLVVPYLLKYFLNKM